MDSAKVRHIALTGPADCGDKYLCDVFTPCLSYVENALDTCDDVSPVTCLGCLTSKFEQETRGMNLEAIEHLDEPSLYEHMIDRDAMSPLHEFDA